MLHNKYFIFYSTFECVIFIFKNLTTKNNKAQINIHVEEINITLRSTTMCLADDEGNSCRITYYTNSPKCPQVHPLLFRVQNKVKFSLASIILYHGYASRVTKECSAYIYL